MSLSPLSPSPLHGALRNFFGEQKPLQRKRDLSYEFSQIETRFLLFTSDKKEASLLEDTKLLLEKNQVLQEQVAAIELLHNEHEEYFRKNPNSSLAKRLLRPEVLEKYYLLTRDFYAGVSVDQTLFSRKFVHPVDLHWLELQGYENLQLTLGRKNGSVPSSIRELHEQLLEKFEGSCFVEYFNRSLSQREKLLPVALWRCETIYNEIYKDPIKRTDLRLEQISPAREALLTLFGCEDPEIKKVALKRYIDVLTADPILEVTYLNLPKQIRRLTQEIELSSSQNLDVATLGILIEAYALTTTQIWLHAEKGDGSVIEKSLKDEIWQKAEEFEKQNRLQNPTIDFWIKFALQAVQRIPTEVTKREIFYNRVFLLAQAALTLTFMITGSIAQEELVASDQSVEYLVGLLKEAFYHLDNPQDWFQPLLAFKYMCHLVQSSPEVIESLVQMALSYKTNEKDKALFFGIVCFLESLLLQTTHAETTKAGFRVLITFLFVDNSFIQKRILTALLRLKREGRETLEVASESLLHLIYQSQSLLKEEFPDFFFQTEHSLSHRFAHLCEEGKTLTSNVLSVFIRFTVDIKTESGMLWESPLGKLTRSNTGDLDGDGSARLADVMLALKMILPEPLLKDSKGNNFLHLCVIQGNLELMGLAIKIFPELDPNEGNDEGRTPLMLCVVPELPPFPEGVWFLSSLEGRDLACKDKWGSTFLHYCVQNRSSLWFRTLLENTPDLVETFDILNLKRKSAFMLCIEEDTHESLAIAKTLLAKGTSIEIRHPDGFTTLEIAFQHRNSDLVRAIPHESLLAKKRGQNPFLLAARANKADALEYLFTVFPDHPFSSEEVQALLKTALKSTRGLSCGKKSKMLALLENQLALEGSLAKAVAIHFPDLSWFSPHSQKANLFFFSYCGSSLSPLRLYEKLFGQMLESFTPDSSSFKGDVELTACFGENPWTQLSFYQQLYEPMLQKILKEDAKQLFLTNFLGCTPLQIALLEGSAGTKKLLLDHKNQPFANRDLKGNQPLHYAAAQLDEISYKKILENLISAKLQKKLIPSDGSLLLPKNNMGLTPLCLTLFLDRHLLPDPIETENPYPYLEEDFVYSQELHARFCSILDDTIKATLWEENEAPKKSQPILEIYPEPNVLHFGAIYGHGEQAKMLCERMPHLFFQIDAEGEIPLAQALSRQRFDVARNMIEGWLRSRSCEEKKREHASLFFLQEELRLYDICLYSVLAQVEDLNRLEEWSRSLFFQKPFAEIDLDYFRKTDFVSLEQVRCKNFHPLACATKIAIQKNNRELLELLFDLDPDFFYLLQDKSGHTPLMLACKLHQSDSLLFLLECFQKKSDFPTCLQTRNSLGETALHRLFSLSRGKALEMLAHHVSSELSANERELLLDNEMHFCLQALLQAGAKIEEKDLAGNTALHLAAGHNYAKLVWLLYNESQEHEVKKIFTALNNDERTPLFLAVANSARESVETLLEIMKKEELLQQALRQRDIYGHTLLHIAAQEGELEICHILVEQNASLEERDDRGENVIHKAAFNRRISVLHYFLSLATIFPHKERLMQPDFNGLSALHKALLLPPLAQRNHRKYKAIYRNEQLQSSPQIRQKHPIGQQDLDLLNETEPQNERNPLSSNKENCTQRIFEAEEEERAELSVHRRDLFDPAELQSIREVLVALIDFGFTMEAPDRLGLTPWHYLMRNSYGDLLGSLFAYYKQNQKKLDFSTLRSHKGETLAHIAARFGQSGALEEVLPYMSKSSLNQKTENGSTAAHFALKNDSLDCLELLLSYGCRKDQTTRPPGATRYMAKEDNWLHLIAKKPILDQRLVDLFKKVSNQQPKLLRTTNLAGRTVFEELAIRGHSTLFSFVISKMPHNRFSKEAIQRALDATGALPQRSNLYDVLAFANLEKYLKRRGFFHSPLPEPSFEELREEAEKKIMPRSTKRELGLLPLADL